MKRKILVMTFILCSFTLLAQENMITFSGGYSFANIEDTDNKGTGWRINALYEFNPGGGFVAHGFSFGYISLTATQSIGQQTTESKLSSIPLYYAPKVIFGKEKIKVFIKGALGMQYSFLKREGAVTLTDNTFGFYGGGGAGLMIFLKENFFINAEYEIAWASNTGYKDGWISTAGAGIGFKF